MKLLRSLLLAACAALALPALAPAAQPVDSEARVIVRFKPQADSVRTNRLPLAATRWQARDVAQARATALGLRTGQRLGAGLMLDERTHVVVARGLTSAQLARRLAADPEVELVAVDQLRKALAVPNDPLFGGATINPATVDGNGVASRVVDQWYLKAPSNTPGQVVSSINATAAWDITRGSPAVVVAVLDTGVRLDHPDLASKFLPGYDLVGNCITGSTPCNGALALAIANDGDGADADPSDPGDWVTQADIDNSLTHDSCASETPSDSSWHGTRVSGLIGAATDNGTGIAGVGWNVKLLPVRVLGKCGGYDSDIMAAMKWAAGLSVPGLPVNPNKAKVINMSLGGEGACGTDGVGGLYRDTVARVGAAGAIVVAAAGNTAGQAVNLPGNCPGVITVTALRHVGTKVGFASVGPEVTVAAPGGNCVNTVDGGSNLPCIYSMVSTFNRGTTTPVPADDSYITTASSVGTSFSAPIVSGIVGLMASVRPDLTAAEAAQILKLTARPFPTSGGGTAGSAAPPRCTAPTAAGQGECYCTTSTCGAGMVDAFGAVAQAQALGAATVAITSSPAGGATAGQVVTLGVTVAGLASGRSVATTLWTLADGGGIVTGFASGANSSTATLVPSAAGTFKVRVEVTDNQGLVYSQVATINVQAPATTSGAGNGGGGGGGGGTSAAWLALLAVAALALKRPSARG